MSATERLQTDLLDRLVLLAYNRHRPFGSARDLRSTLSAGSGRNQQTRNSRAPQQVGRRALHPRFAVKEAMRLGMYRPRTDWRRVVLRTLSGPLVVFVRWTERTSSSFAVWAAPARRTLRMGIPEPSAGVVQGIRATLERSRV